MLKSQIDPHRKTLFVLVDMSGSHFVLVHGSYAPLVVAIGFTVEHLDRKEFISPNDGDDLENHWAHQRPSRRIYAGESAAARLMSRFAKLSWLE